jgi:catechol 2,3-dioxygenase-like lactoylglutathione lyase family enzyme
MPGMPSSLSHVVVLTDDLDRVVHFLTEVAKVRGVERYETVPEEINELFGWPVEHGRARGAFVGEGPGAVDVLEIPEPLRETVQPGVRLLAVVNRDVAAAGEAAAAAGYALRGPFRTTTAMGGEMRLTEVVAGGVSFELVQFG